MNSGAQKYNEFLNGNHYIGYFYFTLQEKLGDIKGEIRRLSSTDNTVANSIKTTKQTIVHKTLRRIPKIEHEFH
jgi:hypothetical protein